MKSLLQSLAALALVAFAAAPSQGAMAYGVTLIGNQLISVDTTTGAGSLVGPLAANTNPYGLVGFNNQLYTFNSSTDAINQISTTTGATVASYSLNTGPVLGQGGLAFATATTGFLTTALDPNTFNYANNLYSFNLTTGATTLIAQTADTLSSLAYASNGTLYALGQGDGNLYTINPTTGAMTLIGNAGLSIGSPVGALTFGPDGTLYGTFDDALYTINTTTGVATAVGDPTVGTGFASISGLAFGNGTLPPAAGTVPEPASALLLAAGLGLVGIRTFRARRVA